MYIYTGSIYHLFIPHSYFRNLTVHPPFSQPHLRIPTQHPQDLFDFVSWDDKKSPGEQTKKPVPKHQLAKHECAKAAYTKKRLKRLKSPEEVKVRLDSWEFTLSICFTVHVHV